MKTANVIEKQVILHAPTSRVWRAISNATEFGQWFGVKLDDEFVAGQAVTGEYPSNLTEGLVIAQQKKLGIKPTAVKIPESQTIFFAVERIEPETYFSFRWIPYSIDAEADPQNEPTTLVEFQLTEVADGTQLTITESGFSQIPAYRRERAFLMNEDGWEVQAAQIKQYVEG